jgi:hypothetical protein
MDGAVNRKRVLTAVVVLVWTAVVPFMLVIVPMVIGIVVTLARRLHHTC